MVGTVKHIVEDRGFGFVASPGQPDTFFHFSKLLDGLEFNAQLVGQRVEFDAIPSEKGPKATFVAPAR